MIVFIIFILYEIFKIRIERLYGKETRPNKLTLICFNIFGAIFATLLFVLACFIGLNLIYVLYILTYIFLVNDIYTKNKKYKTYSVQ